MNKQNVAIISLALLVIVLLGYIAFVEVNSKITARVVGASQEAYQMGLRDTISAVFQETGNCQVATLTLGNQSRRIVDVSCLQQTTE